MAPSGHRRNLHPKSITNAQSAGLRSLVANAQSSRQGPPFDLVPIRRWYFIMFLYLGYWLNHIWLEINADAI